MNTDFINEHDLDKFLELVKENYEECMEGKVSQAELVYFIATVLPAAKRVKGHSNMRLWYVRSDIPGEACIMYIYEPTYMLAAIMVYTLTKYKDVIKIPGLIEQLNKVFNGCMYNEFKGHGIEDMDGLIYAMEIFAKAGIKSFIKKYNYEFHEFATFFLSCKETLKELADGSIKGVWGNDYSEKATEIMKLL